MPTVLGLHQSQILSVAGIEAGVIDMLEVEEGGHQVTVLFH